jgi:hypothetical protein
MKTKQSKSKLLRTETSAAGPKQLTVQSAKNPTVETALQEFNKIKAAYQLSLKSEDKHLIHVDINDLKGPTYQLLFSSGLVEAFGSVASVQFYCLYPKKEVLELPESEIRGKLAEHHGRFKEAGLLEETRE